MAEYVQLTHPDYLPVIVVDIDIPGHPGGSFSCLASDLQRRILNLCEIRLAPNWIGVNSASGKCQLIWYIDPVTSGQMKNGKNRARELYKAVVSDLQKFLGADQHFSHGWSRNPLFSGLTDGSYRWYAQHHCVYHLRYMSWGLCSWVLGDKTMTYENISVEDARLKQRFSSGRELLDFAISSRKKSEEAERAKGILDYLVLDDPKLVKKFDQADPDVVDGVRVCWIDRGRNIAARDETAFRHTMTVGYRLIKAGKKLTNADLIDAYNAAYDVAQEIGSGGRVRDPQKQRELEGLARRVRGYVYGNKSVQQAVNKEQTGRFAGMRPSEKKALATLGRRGAEVSNARRWSDRDSEYAQRELSKLEQANKQRSWGREETKGRVLAYISSERKMGREPATKDIEGCW